MLHPETQKSNAIKIIQKRHIGKDFCAQQMLFIFFREQEDPMASQGNQGPQAHRSVDFHFKVLVKSLLTSMKQRPFAT